MTSTVLVAVVGAALAVVAGDAPAARVGDRTLTLAEIDEATAGRAEALRSRLVVAATNAAWGLVDARLGVEEPPDAVHGSRIDARRAAGARLTLPPAARLESALPPDEVIAWVGETPIAAAELEERAAVLLYRLRGELYRERRRRTAEAVDEALLAREARDRGVAVSDLLEPPAVTDADVARYVEQRRGEGVEVDAREVRPLLEHRTREAVRRALLERLRAGVAVEVLLRPPVPPSIDARDGDAPALGPPAPAERTVVLFGDYRSAASRRVHHEVDRLRDLAGDVRVILRDSIPLPDPVADEAARFARCADRFGRLASMRAELLATTPPPRGSRWYEGEALRALAERLGTDERSLEACLRDPAIVAAVQRDSEAARELGLLESPALVAAGCPLGGLQSAETIVATLEGRPPRAAD